METTQPGVTLAYRRGYFADDPDETARHRVPPAAANAPASPNSALRAAMMRGAPDPTEIIVSVSIAPTAAELEPGLASGNHAAETTRGPIGATLSSSALRPATSNVPPRLKASTSARWISR